MANYFLDSSALVKRYVEEPGSDWVVGLGGAGRGDPIIVSRLAWLEVTSAAVRRARAGDLGEQDLRWLLGRLEEDMRRRYRVVAVGEGTIVQAWDLVVKHGLRAADGLQLACALAARSSLPEGESLTLVSSDRELNEAAVAEQVGVVDPVRGSAER